MNHDYAHCLDFRSDCPKKCFRAQLERDLRKRKSELAYLGIGYQHLQGSEECKRKEAK